MWRSAIYRASFLLTVTVLGGLTVACGSASTNVVEPSAIKCDVAVTGNTPELPASGGSGSLSVDTARDCAWTAATDASWITLGATSGQGPATLNYSVAANPSATARRSRVTVAQQSVDVVQAPAPCRYEVSPTLVNVEASGSQLLVTLTSLAGCSWTARSDVPWITVGTPEGGGSATISVSVAVNPAQARAGTVTIGNAALRVNQKAALSAPEPTPSPTPTPTPTPNPTPVPTPTPTPTPTPPPCSYSIAPTHYEAGRGPDDISVAVTAANGCVWSATTAESWVTISSGQSGSGDGAVRLQISANAGPARTAIVVIAGNTFTLRQEGTVCTANASIKPTHYHAGRGPDDVRIDVRAEAGCSWTAVSPVSWVTIAEGATGIGDGTVRLQIQPNSGEPRSVTLTIAGQPFELRQDGE
jgi:hypothetical protein